MTTAAPPEAPTPEPTDEQAVNAALQQVVSRLSGVTDQQQAVQIMGNALFSAVIAERGRCVRFLKEQAGQAEAVAKAARQHGDQGVAAQAHRAASMVGRLANGLALPPGVVAGATTACKTCRGTGVVRSKVAATAGVRAMVPCPEGCARPAGPLAVHAPDPKEPPFKATQIHGRLVEVVVGTEEAARAWAASAPGAVRVTVDAQVLREVGHEWMAVTEDESGRHETYGNGPLAFDATPAPPTSPPPGGA